MLKCFTDFTNLDGFATGTAGPPPEKGAVKPIATNGGTMNKEMKKTQLGKIDIFMPEEFCRKIATHHDSTSSFFHS
jgi:hypothetical protein